MLAFKNYCHSTLLPMEIRKCRIANVVAEMNISRAVDVTEQARCGQVFRQWQTKRMNAAAATVPATFDVMCATVPDR